MWFQACLLLISFMLLRGMDIDGWDELNSVTSLDSLLGEVNDTEYYDRGENCARRTDGREKNVVAATNRLVPPQSQWIDDDLTWNQLDPFSSLLSVSQPNHAGSMTSAARSRNEQASYVGGNGHERNSGPKELDPCQLWLTFEPSHHLDFSVPSPDHVTEGASLVDANSRLGGAMAGRAGRHEFLVSGAKESSTSDDYLPDCLSEEWGESEYRNPLTLIQDPLNESNSRPHQVRSSSIQSESNLRQEIASGTCPFASVLEGRHPTEKYEAYQSSPLISEDNSLGLEEASTSRETLWNNVWNDIGAQTSQKNKDKDFGNTSSSGKRDETSFQFGHLQDGSTKTDNFERNRRVASEAQKPTFSTQESNGYINEASSIEGDQSASLGSLTTPINEVFRTHSHKNFRNKRRKSSQQPSNIQVEAIAGSEDSLERKRDDEEFLHYLLLSDLIPPNHQEVHETFQQSSLHTGNETKKLEESRAKSRRKISSAKQNEAQEIVNQRERDSASEFQAGAREMKQNTGPSFSGGNERKLLDDYQQLLDKCQTSIESENYQLYNFDWDLFKDFETPTKEDPELFPETISKPEVIKQTLTRHKYFKTVIRKIINSQDMAQRLCFANEKDVYPKLLIFKGGFPKLSRLEDKKQFGENKEKYKKHENKSRKLDLYKSRDWMLPVHLKNMLEDKFFLNGLYTKQISDELKPFMLNLRNVIQQSFTPKQMGLYFRSFRETTTIFLFYVKMIISMVPKTTDEKNNLDSDTGFLMNQAWNLLKIIHAKLLVPQNIIADSLKQDDFEVKFLEEITSDLNEGKVDIKRQFNIGWYLISNWMVRHRPTLFHEVSNWRYMQKTNWYLSHEEMVSHENLNQVFKFFFNDIFVYTIDSLRKNQNNIG